MSIIPQKSKDFHSKTKYRQEEELNKLRAQEEEVIDEIGQESETRAVKSVTEYVKEQQKQDEERQMFFKEALTKALNDKQLYQRKLIFILQEFVKEEYVPKQYKLYVNSTDDGITLGIQGTELVSAIQTSGIPKYDIYACRILALRLGNTIARMEGHMRETASGIVLATEKELEIATKHGRKSSK